MEPVTREHADIARAAYRDFGKGSGHPAGLNFGDCFAYALAKSMGTFRDVRRYRNALDRLIAGLARGLHTRRHPLPVGHSAAATPYR